MVSSSSRNPVAFEIWNVYLSKFVKRYGGAKLERAETCSSKHSTSVLHDSAAADAHVCKLEEDHGLAKRAMKIYDRATRAASTDDRYDMFVFYLAKAAANFGLAATRPIYERAIESLPDRQTADMCLRFAELERKLGEVDRARAIYAHASQFCDPRTHAEFWKQWNQFEIDTGSEDTFREMLRIKRSVQAQFNTDVSYIAARLSRLHNAIRHRQAAMASLLGRRSTTRKRGRWERSDGEGGSCFEIRRGATDGVRCSQCCRKRSSHSRHERRWKQNQE